MIGFTCPVGAVQLTRSILLPATTDRFVGASGGPVVVTVTPSEAGPGWLFEFSPRTLKVYCVWSVKPVVTA